MDREEGWGRGDLIFLILDEGLSWVNVSFNWVIVDCFFLLLLNLVWLWTISEWVVASWVYSSVWFSILVLSSLSFLDICQFDAGHFLIQGLSCLSSYFSSVGVTLDINCVSLFDTTVWVLDQGIRIWSCHTGLICIMGRSRKLVQNKQTNKPEVLILLAAVLPVLVELLFPLAVFDKTDMFVRLRFSCGQRSDQ